MTVYHGSSAEIIDVDLSKCEPYRDFGRGFYVTNIREQAAYWAERKGYDSGTQGYVSEAEITLENIVEYHYRSEKIHPFQDGNGRVGRLILFRECLRNNITPFIIGERHKQLYYRGLREFDAARGYLLDACLAAQDTYTEMGKVFF